MHEYVESIVAELEALGFTDTVSVRAELFKAIVENPKRNPKRILQQAKCSIIYKGKEM